MRFSTQTAGAAAMATLATAHSPAAVSERTPLGLDLPNGLDLSEPIQANVDLGVDLSGTTLVAGVVAGVSVDPLLDVGADVEVAIVCKECYTKGDINATVSLEKAVPALSLTLSDIEVMLDLDISIDAAANIAVNLVTPDIKLDLDLAGLKVEASVFLDLVIGVDAELDLSAGIYASLAEEASLEIDIFSAELIDASFTGLAVKVLPVEVRIGCTKLLADLRLRVELGVAAEVDVDDVLPLDSLLGLDLPEVGAGLELSVWTNLMEYVGLFCATPSCPLSEESYGLNVGLAIDLDVSIEDLLDLHLQPTVSIPLLSAPTSSICDHPSYTSTPAISATTPATTAPATTAPATTAPATTAAPGGGDMITSTVTNVQTYTVTKCAANVANCAPGYGTEDTVIHTTVFTTVCPATMTGSITAAPTATYSKAPSVSTITKSVVTMVPCSSEASTFTPPTNVPSAPYPTKPVASTTKEGSSSSATAPVGNPSATAPVDSPSTTAPVDSPSTTAPVDSPSATAPVDSPSATAPVDSPSATAPVDSPSATAPVDSPSATAPVDSPSATAPVDSPSAPVDSPSVGYPTGGASTYPVAAPSADYPAGGESSYPVGGPSASYPAGVPSGVPSVSYPAGGASSTAPVYTTAVPYPTAPVYPTGPAGYNGTTSAAQMTTYQPSASMTYSASSSAPAAPSESVVVGGAAKVGSGVAGAFAVVGAIVALL